MVADTGTIFTGGTKREFRWWIEYSRSTYAYEFFVIRTDYEMIPVPDEIPGDQEDVRIAGALYRRDPSHPGFTGSWSDVHTYSLTDDGRWEELARTEGFLNAPLPCHTMTAEFVHVLAGAGVPIEPDQVAEDLATFLRNMLTGIGHTLDRNPGEEVSDGTDS